MNHDIIRKKGLDLAEVQDAVASELMTIKGVALAISSTSIMSNKLPDTYLSRKALRNFNMARSGDILILLQPQYFYNDFEGEIVASNHGSPWTYDSYVPVIFAGWKFKNQNISRKVEPKDIAITLTNILGTKPPSGADGEVLFEVSEQGK